MNSGDTSTPIKPAMLIFHLNQQYQQERTLHHLLRPPDNGPHISFYSPPSQQTVTWTWHSDMAANQIDRLRDTSATWSCFIPASLEPPTPPPKCKRGLSMSFVRALHIMCFIHAPWQAFCYSNYNHRNHPALFAHRVDDKLFNQFVIKHISFFYKRLCRDWIIKMWIKRWPRVT